jgi:hypothetical protein
MNNTTEKTRSIKFDGMNIRYYPESLTIRTDVKTNGFTLESTVTAEIYADTVRTDGNGETVDYDKVWGWSMTVDALGGEHLADYMDVAETLARHRAAELRGEYSCH